MRRRDHQGLLSSHGDAVAGFELGIDAFGIDLSPAMIDVARHGHPGLRFEVAR